SLFAMALTFCSIKVCAICIALFRDAGSDDVTSPLMFSDNPQLGVTLLIKIVVLRYGNDVEQQQWIIDNIRLLFIILASCELMNAIYTYRDYDSLNHQMLQTLVDKVNKLRNKNDDNGYNDDVDWSSWIDSDITEDELDDLEYVPPKGVPETSFITTSLRNYNLRSRH
nr:protein gamete expressed 1 [Tanacetum cinerariifolium]